jgi:hypothetical protein
MAKSHILTVTGPFCPVAAPRQGQAFFYLGDNTEAFRDVFSAYGFVR